MGSPKTTSRNDLEPASLDADAQEWDTLPIAVSPELKARVKRVAESMGLKPSQWGRMILMDAVTRHENKAA